jgi:hypothetical protein
MKFAWFAMPVLLAACDAPPKAGWQLVGRTEEMITVAYTPAARVGERAEIWTSGTYLNPDKVGFVSYRGFVEVDCAARRLRTTEVVLQYRDGNLLRIEGAQQWRSASSDEFSRKVEALACGEPSRAKRYANLEDAFAALSDTSAP